MNTKSLTELKQICKKNNIKTSKKGVLLRKNQLLYAIRKYNKQKGGGICSKLDGNPKLCGYLSKCTYIDGKCKGKCRAGKVNDCSNCDENKQAECFLSKLKCIRGLTNSTLCNSAYLPTETIKMCTNNCNNCENSCKCRGNNCNLNICTRNNCKKNKCKEDISLKILYKQCSHFNKLLKENPNYAALIGNILHFLKSDIITESGLLGGTGYTGFPFTILEAYLTSTTISLDELSIDEEFINQTIPEVNHGLNNNKSEIEIHLIDFIIKNYILVYISLEKHDDRIEFMNKIEELKKKIKTIKNNDNIFKMTNILIASHLIHL